MGTPEFVGETWQKYRTVSLSEVHYVGAERLPTLHVIRQEIEAIDVCRKFPFYFDERNVEQVVGAPGCLVNNFRYAGRSLTAADIVLQKSLQPGERTTAEFKCYWRRAPLYGQQWPGRLPECRRRIGDTAMENVTMAVSFGAAPKRIWEADWDDIYPSALIQPGTQAELELGPPPADEENQGAFWAERHVEFAQRGRVFGITWEW